VFDIKRTVLVRSGVYNQDLASWYTPRRERIHFDQFRSIVVPRLSPNVEECLGGLFIYQCDGCVQENVVGGMAEFLGRRLEEYRRTLRTLNNSLYILLRHNFQDNKIKSLYLSV
jgi:hypothetical protein